jgi:hypothetical protein
MDTALKGMEGEDMEGSKKIHHFGYCNISERDVQWRNTGSQRTQKKEEP